MTGRSATGGRLSRPRGEHPTAVAPRVVDWLVTTERSSFGEVKSDLPASAPANRPSLSARRRARLAQSAIARRRDSLNRRWFLNRRGTLAATVTAILALSLAACGSTPTRTHGRSQASSAAALQGVDPGTPIDKQPAPDIHLINQFGQPTSLSQFRGKVVLLAFVDSECTTVCPLTTVEMVLARQMLGAAGGSVQLLGVDANPQATAVSDVMAYSRVHDMVNQWDFLTGTKAQLSSTWAKFHIYTQISRGLVDHTPALFLIDRQGRERAVYLTQMVYTSISRQAVVLARQISALLPGHPRVSGNAPTTPQASLDPSQSVSLPSATTSGGTVKLAPGTPHLVMFFATWLSETSDLKASLIRLNSYAATARKQHLPALTAVDEATTEPSTNAVRSFLRHLGTPLAYPVGLDASGRVADGYQVQDQPWFALTSASGKILWSHDGWLPLSSLERAVRQHATGQ